MSKRHQSGTEVQHQGENLREQLHAIVNHEMALFDNVDRIGEVGELQDRISRFMDNLQQGFGSYLIEIERENAKQEQVSRAKEVEDKAAVEVPETKPQIGPDGKVMNLEQEFRTYGIKQANGINEVKRPLSYTVIQSLLGTAIAASLMWVFWPTAGDEEVQRSVAEPKQSIAKHAAEVVPAPAAVVVKEEPAKTEVVKADKTEPTAVAQMLTAPPAATVKVSKAKPEAAASVVSQKPKGKKITVTAHYGNVRSAPDGKVVSRLKKGEVVYKLEERDGWYRVMITEELTAWVHGSLFAPRLQLHADVGNIRAKPTSKGSIITRLKRGDYVTKLGEKNEWYQVKLDSGKTAWAHRSIF